MGKFDNLITWVNIPTGKVTLEGDGYVPEGGQIYDVPAFWITKYPITNAQFAPFIEAGGYRERRWWTEAGWQRKEKDNWVEPRFWQFQMPDKPDVPIVGVSYYECVAFCQWLSEMIGENIMLPTEKQWQRAAQGDDGRIYPWGNEWDANRCNHGLERGQKPNSTNLITQYEGKDESPFGVVDMGGNVREWCVTIAETGETTLEGTELRILKGGSWWSNDLEEFSVAHADWEYAWYAMDNIGFRCVRNL